MSDMEKAEGENCIETKTNPKVMNDEDDIDALMPKLRSNSYYYTKPTIKELAARERAEPGYIGRVKDFVVGRHGAGSIRFLGEIDLRGVKLESFFEIVPGRVIYRVLKPLPPQAFNDTAEMTMVSTTKFTLKEIRRSDIKARIHSNAARLKKRAENDGGQFISYDPIKGEYKWRTKYFSGLGLIGFEQKKKTSKKKMTMGIQILIKCFICGGEEEEDRFSSLNDD